MARIRLKPTDQRNRAALANRYAGTVIPQAVAGMPAFWRQRAHTERLDLWMKGRQQEIDDDNSEIPNGGTPYSPRRNDTTDEYQDLSSRSPAPVAKLIVRTLAQTIYVDSARISGTKEGATLRCWDVLVENEWTSRQIPLHNSAIGHGLAYVKALPGKSPIDGSDSAIVRPVSAKRMAAYYDDLDDEWPAYAIQVDEQPKAKPEDDQVWQVQLFDEANVHYLSFKNEGLEASDWTYISFEPHDLGVCPIVRFSNYTDLDGLSLGEIEPVIPLLRAIDQDTFDRLIVQRFGAWKVRYVAGLAKPTTQAGEQAQKLALRMMDIMVAEDADTKFGTLDETPTDGYIAARDADMRMLSAVTQTPPHHLLGVSSNLQAEALAAAEAGLQRKSIDFKILNATSHERLLRLIAKIINAPEEAMAKNIEIRYRDTESRSLVQAADALGKLATMLGIPVEMLWSRVPGWTEDDTTRAKQLIADGGVDRLLIELEKMSAEAQQPPAGDAQSGDAAQQESADAQSAS